MKRFVQIALIVTIALSLTAVSTNAQMPIKFGFKGGVTMTNVTGDDTEGSETKSGIAGGIFSRISLPGGLSLQPELLYVQKGTKGTAEDNGSSIDVTLKMDYIEIPILLKYNFKTNGAISPCLFAGPAFASTRESKTELKATLLGLPFAGEVDNFNEASSDLGFVLGGGIDFSLGRSLLTMEVRYTSGTKVMWEDVNIADLPDDEMVYADDQGQALDMKNSAISFLIGFMF